MNKPILLCVLVWASVNGARLTRIHMGDYVDKVYIEYYFAGEGDEIRIPKFFQHFKKSDQTFSINFLETESEIDLGIYAAPANNPYASQIVLKKIKRKKNGQIRNFLSVEFSALKGMDKKRYPAVKADHNLLRLELPIQSNTSIDWLLAPQTSQIAKNNDTQPEGTIDPKHVGDKAKTFTVKPEIAEYIVLRDEVNLRSQPRVDVKVVGKLAIGTEVTRISEKNNWFLVVAGKDSGYIRKDMIVRSDGLNQAQLDKINSVIEAKEKKVQEEEAKQRAEAERKEKEVLAAKQKEEEKRRITEEKEAEKVRLKKEKEEREAEEKRKETLAAKQKQEEDERKAVAKKLEQERLEKEKQQRAVEKQNRLAAEKRLKAQKASLANAEKLQQETRNEAEEDWMMTEKKLAAKLINDNRTTIQTKKSEPKKAKRVHYSSFGSRDPFLPLKELAIKEGNMRIDQMKLVGIIWETHSPLAVLEHRMESGISLTVKEGDVINNGTVVQITKKECIFDISEYGVIRSYTLRLVSPIKRMSP
ncbi:MAG: SH3 domain-containing protein [Fibrobacteria bacterium]|nr:SH3 domain-containing protein [Fibrobacteria bacterium]